MEEREKEVKILKYDTFFVTCELVETIKESTIGA
jgi:hypothetical protein